jgi:hypothetical protein
MIVIFTPLLGLIAAIGTAIVFAVPKCFQAVVAGALVHRFGDPARVASLLVLPITAVITWYCYHYLTPSDLNLGIDVGPDWQPYQHGLTAARYLATLACQTPATLFSLAYSPHGRVCGYHLAGGQYQFL